MELFLHIIDRAFYHFVSSILITGGVFMVLRMLIRRKWRYVMWLPEKKRPQLLLCGVCWPGYVIVREAFDVLNGQPVIKAVTDAVSWMVLGSLLGIWLLYRYGEEWSKGE